MHQTVRGIVELAPEGACQIVVDEPHREFFDAQPRRHSLHPELHRKGVAADRRTQLAQRFNAMGLEAAEGIGQARTGVPEEPIIEFGRDGRVDGAALGRRNRSIQGRKQIA